MIFTFSIGWLATAAGAALLLIVNIPALSGGVSAVECGKYRVAWTRHGWSYQYDYEYPNGTSGFWPWYNPSPPREGGR